MIFSKKCDIDILTIFWKWHDNCITIYRQTIFWGLVLKNQKFRLPLTKRSRSEILEPPCTPALLSKIIIRNEDKLISAKKCQPIASETSIQYLKNVFSNSKDNLSANFTFLKMQLIKRRSNTDAVFSPRIVLTNFSLLH